MHDPSKHHLLAPSDLPQHLIDDHKVITPVLPTPTQICVYLVNHGIESTGDATLDAYLVWHEKTHAYSASRTTEQRRAEQQ